MDIVRQDVARKKRIRQIIVVLVVLIGLAGITVGVSLLEPAPQRVEGSAVWIDQVQRGQMVRQVRGIGSLVPEEIRFLTAETAGTVEQVHRLPGSFVTAEDVIH
ncbi:MAG: hypothetical protein ACFE0O_07570 [Opitutales bacterium]